MTNGNRAGRSARCVERIFHPVFVVGCCNSGTTILWQALRQHPDFDGPPTEGQDLVDLPQCMKHFLGPQTSRMFAHPEFEFAYRVTERGYRANLARRLTDVYAEHCEPGKRLIEKSPANSVRTRFLQAVFPNASFVIIIRNGMAVAEGIRRKRWYDPDRPHLAGLRTTIREAAEQWHYANRILLHDAAFLKRRIFVRYEELVSDPAGVLSKAFRFCGCDAADFRAPRYEVNHDVRQVARLTAAEQGTVRAVTGPLLTKLGYMGST